MFRNLLKRPILFSAVIAAPKVDEIVSDNQSRNNGWARVYHIFTVDEDGMFSPQMNTILQTTFYTAFFGGCYGGFIHSREAYLRFMERNQGTEFTDHYQAKKKLQDFVTVNFAKGAFKWAWRLSLFGGLYISFVTLLGAYYDESSIWHFGLAGLLSGGIYRVNLGLRGLIVGGTLGSMIGLFAGALTMTILKLSGSSVDDVQQWHHDIIKTRHRYLTEKPASELSESQNTGLKEISEDK